MDLEKAYDKVRRRELWSVLEEYGVRGRLGKGVKAFYKNSRMCVRVGRGESEMCYVSMAV